MITKPLLLDETGRDIAQAIRDTGRPTDEQVNKWLTEHPEATTTIQDGAITEDKLNFEVVKRRAVYFNSVFEMKESTILKAGMYACTTGYYEPNDGGGVAYRIRTKADSDIDDGGSLHELQNNLVAELIIENGIVNAKQFGARGDGITDDTEAIQNAINAASNNAIVILPAGKYKVSKTINIQSTINIKGECSEIIPATGGFIIFRATGTIGDEIELAEPADIGSKSIVTKTINGAAVGDIYYLHSQRDCMNIADAGIDWVLGTPTINLQPIHFGEPIQVLQTKSENSNLKENELLLTTRLIFPGYKTNNSTEQSTFSRPSSTIQKIEFVKDVKITGLKFTNLKDNNICIYFTRGYNCIVEDVRVESDFIPFHSIYFLQCYKCTARHVITERKPGIQNMNYNHSKYNSYFSVSSWFSTFDNCTDINGMQSIDISCLPEKIGSGTLSLYGPDINTTIRNCTMITPIEEGFTNHPGQYGLHVIGCNIEGGNRIAQVRCRNTVIENCIFRGTGVHDTYAKYGLYLMSFLDYILPDGNPLKDKYAAYYNGTIIRNNTFINCGAGVIIYNPDSITGTLLCDVRIIGNNFVDCTSPIVIRTYPTVSIDNIDSYPGNLLIEGNTFTRSYNEEIILDNTNGAIINNNTFIDSNGNTTTLIYRTANNVNTSIKGNIFKNIGVQTNGNQKICFNTLSVDEIKEGRFIDNSIIGEGTLVESHRESVRMHSDIMRGLAFENGTAIIPKESSEISISHNLGYPPHISSIFCGFNGTNTANQNYTLSVINSSNSTFTVRITPSALLDIGISWFILEKTV